jgi:L-rhamnose isomerase/sugar isomerase
MIDQSHNITDPLESMLSSAEAIAGAFTRALLIDRSALAAARDQNDVMGAFLALRRGYNVDVAPILAMARIEANGAADPIAMYRETEWRARQAQQRKRTLGTAGIV